jgi:putative acetyltransferase
MQIRQIQPDDNAALSAIIKSVLNKEEATNELYQTFQHPGAVYFIAELDGEIIGGGGIYPTSNLPEGYCELVRFYIVKGFRGIGLGTTILDACFKAACNFGYTHVYLESMTDAIEIYKKRGFRLLREPLINSECTIWMKKVLHY